MKAVIMAGGEGTRLRPLTCNRPKPMVTVANKPVMEHILDLLVKHNLKDVAVTLQYMPYSIKDYFDDGKNFGVNMRYYIEQTPLGTAGSVKNAEGFLNDTFVVISGDALTDIDLTRAIDFHRQKNSMATLVLKKVDVPLEYGVVVTDKEDRITRFLEKPSWGEVFSDTVNTGIYILSPEIFKYYKKDEVFDFSKDLFPILLKERKPMYGFITEDYWCDIGDLKAYNQAHIDILEGKVHINIPGRQIKDKVWVDEGTTIEDGANIKAPCIIGKNCRIRKGAVIEDYSVVGDSNVIAGRAGIKRSILWKNCTIDQNVQLRGTVLCDKIHMKDSASSFENSVIGDDTVIKDNATIKPDIKIWPAKVIEKATEVNSNLIWGSKFTRSIFGNRGIAGEINVDITPEYASKLGAAYGAVLKGKARVAVSCDDSTAAQMLKISFMAGLLSSGVEVYDFGKMLLPATRSAVRFYNTDGGIHISTCCSNIGKLYVDFLDKKGSNIDRGTERKIETAFIREDFSRCEGDCIKPVKVIPDYEKFYTRNIINNVRSKNLDFKVLINAPSALIANTAKELMQELGCKVEFAEDSTEQGLISSERSVKNFAHQVKTGNYNLGVAIEDNAEKMMLVDEKGRIVTEDMFIVLVSIILFKAVEGGTVVVPLSASNVVEKIAALNQGKVVRSKTSHQEIMNSILGTDVKEVMLDQFTLHFDAMAGLIRMLDFMAENRYSLSDLINLIPDFYMSRREVECPWDAKGKVIRQLIQENDSDNIETVEGVKIVNENGWVLVLPDGEQPVCKVISEGYSAEFAEELSTMYVNKIREISRS